MVLVAPDWVSDRTLGQTELIPVERSTMSADSADDGIRNASDFEAAPGNLLATAVQCEMKLWI